MTPPELGLVDVANLARTLVTVASVYALIFLLGCGSNVTVSPVRLPTGERGAVVECKRIAYCLEAAGEACRNGYEVITADSTSSSDVKRNVFTGEVLAIESRRGGTMMIRCRRDKLADRRGPSY